MSIEANARRYISNAIELDKQLTSIEIREKLKGKILVTCEEYIQLKIKVADQINILRSAKLSNKLMQSQTSMAKEETTSAMKSCSKPKVSAEEYLKSNPKQSGT
jgi:hypothetical protein